MNRSAQVEKVVEGVRELLMEIFSDADTAGLEWLYHSLTPLMADMAMMRAAWLPSSMDEPADGADAALPGAEPDFSIVENLEMEIRSEPAEPKEDFTE